MNAYCIFCKTGSEKSIVQHLQTIHPEIEAIIPVRILQEKRKGEWVQQERPLIPGYVFLYAETQITFDKIKGHKGVYKILEYPTGKRELIGGDYEYALWIYKHNGKIGPSVAVTEGGTVRVTEGSLLDGVGKIIKLDRHKRRAVVEFEFYGNKQRISLSVLDLTPDEERESQ